LDKLDQLLARGLNIYCGKNARISGTILSFLRFGNQSSKCYILWIPCLHTSFGMVLFL